QNNFPIALFLQQLDSAFADFVGHNDFHRCSSFPWMLPLVRRAASDTKDNRQSGWASLTGRLDGGIYVPDRPVIDLDRMRTLEQTTAEVLQLASTHFKVPADSLSPEDDFFRKLGINSLQALDMLTRLENHFGIELPDYEMQGVSDFRTLASRIQSRL